MIPGDSPAVSPGFLLDTPRVRTASVTVVGRVPCAALTDLSGVRVVQHAEPEIGEPVHLAAS